MRELRNRLVISAPIEQAFNWFINMDINYINWHPVLHVNWEWLTEKPVGTNSLFYFEEKTKTGNKHKLTMRISECIENKKLCFSSVKMQFESKYFPSSLIAVFGKLFMVSMKMEREFISNSPNQTTIITKHRLGSQIPIIGNLIDWGIEKFLFTKKDHLDHLKEEGIYMKRYLEKTNTS